MTPHLAIGFGRAISTDVLIKLDFCDVSRRKKPLKKQTKGKKRLKAAGRLEVLQKPFLAVIGVGAGGLSGHSRHKMVPVMGGIYSEKTVCGEN